MLTGTPIQNSLVDLWALVDWVHPGRLGTLHAFGTHFEIPIRAGSYVQAGPLQRATAYRCATLLRKLVAPVLLRRWKRQVATQLPQKREQVLFHPILRMVDYLLSTKQGTARPLLQFFGISAC